jgi:hypothetical protein
MTVKNGGGLSSSQGRRRARRGSGERGKGVVRSGGLLAFYRGWGHAGEGLPGGNGVINVFNAIEDGEVKRMVKEGVLMAGRIKARGSHSRRGAGRHGVAGRGGIRWRHSRGWPTRGGRRSLQPRSTW